MNSVAVIDYGMGNLHSVSKALERSAAELSDRVHVVVSGKPEDILGADRVVLPGVGAMRDCMGELKRLGLDDVVREVAQAKPLLGICVGMQALVDSSEENDGVECLGILPGQVSYFGEDLHQPGSAERLKIPHMGWNQVHQEIDHPMWRDIDQDARFYFVHSYYVQSGDPALIAATTDYGITFCSAITRENIFAVQFHPEKSQHAGLTLYRNFLRWDGKG